MLRRFLFRCDCGRTYEGKTNIAPTCCGRPMKRDYKAEGAQAAYHPTKGR